MRVKYCENTLAGLLASIMEEYHVPVIYLIGRCGSEEVLGVVAVMPAEGQVPVGSLYRRLQEELGTRFRLYCVKDREETEGGRENE